MTCQHANKTLTSQQTNTSGSAYKVWWCEDCHNTVVETVRAPEDTLYACNGDCVDCPNWEEHKEGSA